jgi:FAD/FMN-containing dehydrogenase
MMFVTMAVTSVGSPPKAAVTGPGRMIGEAPAPVLSNWNKSYFFTPNKYVEPTTIEEIQAIVRDTATYPSPVIALGSQHTVNQAMVNEAGTVIQLHAWSDIYGIEDRPDELIPGLGKKVVRVQPGVQMIDLAKWLDARGFECSFAPEIGNATVGSLASCTSKDSSLKAPGTFGSLVATVTYVSYTGQLVTIDRGTDQDAMEEYNSSYNMKGIAVELTIVVRPRVLVKTLVTAYKTDDSLPSKLLQLMSEADNIWAIIDLDACTVEQRWQFASAQAWLRTPGFIVEAYRRYRYNLFLVGHNSPISTIVPRITPITFIHNRWQLTNSYPEVSAKQACASRANLPA